MILQGKTCSGILPCTLTILKLFFPYCVREWNKINPKLRNSPSLSVFKRGYLALIRPKECSIYNIIDPYGLKLLIRLHVN